MCLARSGAVLARPLARKALQVGGLALNTGQQQAWLVVMTASSAPHVMVSEGVCGCAACWNHAACALGTLTQPARCRAQCATRAHTHCANHPPPTTHTHPLPAGLAARRRAALAQISRSRQAAQRPAGSAPSEELEEDLEEQDLPPSQQRRAEGGRPLASQPRSRRVLAVASSDSEGEDAPAAAAPRAAAAAASAQRHSLGGDKEESEGSPLVGGGKRRRLLGKAAPVHGPAAVASGVEDELEDF